MTLAKWIGIGAGLAAVYAGAVAGLFWAMCQPPDRFGRIMKHVPMPLMMFAPFESLWNIARGGTLSVGDAAPDFELPTHDKASRIRLAEFRGVQPVVLVFGSYT